MLHPRLTSSIPLTRRDRFTRRGLALIGLAGAVLLVDGALRGELRHRLVGIALGLALLLPLATVALLGARTLKFWRKAVLSVLVLALTLAATEGIVRWLDVSSLSAAELDFDPVLGHALRKGRGGMDAWGFRNQRVPERASIVCLGDSQTFGVNIPASDTWPRSLARRSGAEVYNLGLGGYGPLQYLALIERALELEPRIVVVGFFIGNDLLDAHRFAGLEHWAALRDPALEYRVPDDIEREDRRSLNLSMALVDGLVGGSRLMGRLAAEIKLELKVNPALAGLFGERQASASLDEGPVRTHFAPEYWVSCIRLARPAVRDGLRINAVCLDGILSACRERSVELVLLFLPTKEAVYARWLSERGDERAARLLELSQAEAEAAAAVANQARERGVRVVDPTPDLVAALEEGVACWPTNSDCHFNSRGCERVAGAVWSEIADRFASPSLQR
jgi:hypothetical protein